MMIDLETLDTRPSSVIVSVGAVVFDTEKIIRTAYWVLNLDEQVRAGRTLSVATAIWWTQQSDQARAVFKEKNTHCMSAFENAFMGFFEGEKLQLWSNGADFDLPIMVDLWQRHNLTPIAGWRYSNHRCFRTFNWLTSCRDLIKRQGTHHNALDDAIFQTDCLLEYWKQEREK